jgi:hypothetical protein
MTNLLPLRPGGTLAGITTSQDAHAISVAHSRLDNILSVGMAGESS